MDPLRNPFHSASALRFRDALDAFEAQAEPWDGWGACASEQDTPTRGKGRPGRPTSAGLPRPLPHPREEDC